MITIRYALIIRDERDQKLAVVGTGRDLQTKHGSITPQFRAFCFSCFRMHLDAVCIETVAWQRGVDVEQSPLVVRVTKSTDLANSLTYSFPDQS